MPINYKLYPPDWKETVERIKTRARNKCEVCGIKNYHQPWSYTIFVRINSRYKLKTFWIECGREFERIKSHVHSWKRIMVVLTVAHLDHDENNWSVKDDRLKAMCQYCHLNYDAKEKMKRVIEKARRNNEHI